MNKGEEKSMRLSLLDDFIIEEIFAEDGEGTTADGEALRRDVERAELLARKLRLKDLRREIDKERSASRVVKFDPEQMRAKLSAAANDSTLKMTLAARSGNAAASDDLDDLLEDLAELEQDAEARDRE